MLFSRVCTPSGLNKSYCENSLLPYQFSITFGHEKSRGIKPRLSLEHLIDFPLDVPQSAVDCCFGKVQLHLDFDNAFPFHPEIKHRPLLVGEVAHPSEMLAFRLGEFFLEVDTDHSLSRRRIKRRRATARKTMIPFLIRFAVFNSRIISLASTSYHHTFSLTPNASYSFSLCFFVRPGVASTIRRFLSRCSLKGMVFPFLSFWLTACF